jgi:predicted PurR-regulated permease PerM
VIKASSASTVRLRARRWVANVFEGGAGMSTVVERNSSVTEGSLAILAMGAVLAFLWLARELVLPTVLAVFLAFTVHPLVAWLERRKVPLGAAALIGTLFTTLVVAGILAVLYNRISAFWAELPEYEDRIRQVFQTITRHVTLLQRQGEQLVKPQPGVVKVQEGVPWGVMVVGTAQSALALAGEATVAVFALYFALAEGPRFREKLLHALGRDAAARDRAQNALREIHHDLQQYMVNRLLLNAALGAVTWIVYALYGLEHAAIWGLTTALLHFVPYVGPAVGLALPTAMALLQYGSAKSVGIVAGIYVVLVSVQGNVVDPIFLGKQLRLSSIVIFLGSLFWFWIWGPVGLFLAVPLLSAIRICCAHVPRLRVAAEFLGE